MRARQRVRCETSSLISALVRLSIRLLFDAVLDLAELFHLTANGLADLDSMILLPRLERQIGRRAQKDEVAWLQGHNEGEILDHLADMPEHVVGARILMQLAVDPGPDAQITRIANEIARYDNPAHRCIAGKILHPDIVVDRRVVADLTPPCVMHSEIVGDRIAGD